MSVLPSPDSAFRWTATPAGPALVCEPLARVAQHLYTTRSWALGIRAEDSAAWGEVGGALELDSDVVRLRQVHGASALVIRRDEDAGRGAVEADIVVTDRAGTGLAVKAADCVPLLIADRRTGAIAAAHAGWRGMAARVPAVAVATLAREFGSRAADLIAAAGPSIGSCCYEVGREVRRAFEERGFTAEQAARWFYDRAQPSPHNWSMPGVDASRRRPDRWFFDGWTCVSDQLAAAGVPPDQIFGARLCTASHPAILCSYRREGASAGRLAGAIRR